LNPLFLQYFKDYTYFKNIINIIQKIRLSEIEESYLRLFVSYSYSAYDIGHNKIQEEIGHNKLNDNTYRRAKNILLKLKKLKLIDFIIEKEKNPHNRKSYFLTNNGLFYIIKASSFSSIDIQAMLRNYPDFKIFKDLLYPFMKSETLCSVNIPRDILNSIFLYIQQYCLKIENFIHYAKNKVEWQVDSWNWNEELTRDYLINKYKYNWLENAEIKKIFESTILKFFNKDKPKREYIDIRLEKDKTSAYIINGIQKKKKDKIPNIEHFLIKFHLSKEESIGRSFSLYYTISPAEFGFLLLSGSTSYTYDISLIFSKDEKFIRALEAAKEEFDKLYLAIKNPDKYSFESLFMEGLWELAHKKSKDAKC
jgi:hypothetical protein